MNTKVQLFLLATISFSLCTKTYCPRTPTSTGITRATQQARERKAAAVARKAAAKDWERQTRIFEKAAQERLPEITLTQQHPAQPLRKARSSGGLSAPTISSKRKSEGLRRSKTEEELPPLSARSDFSIESAGTLSPREIDKIFIKSVQASATGYAPGGEADHEIRIRERLGRKVPASELDARVTAHMEEVRRASEQSRAALAAAAAIETRGMSKADLEAHRRDLTERFGENAHAAISSLLQKKKESSPSGWYPGARR